MADCFNFIIDFDNKNEKIEMASASDSEFFQLKMLISVKFKIYDLSKYYMYYQESLLSDTKDNEPIRNIFTPNCDNHIKILNEKLENRENSEIKLNSATTKKSENTKEKNFKIAYLCSCNNKSEATYVCLKCQKLICEQCKQRDPHIIHINDIIKYSNFRNYLIKFNETQSIKLDTTILSSESFIFLQEFKHNLVNDIEKISKNYEYLKSLLENVKDSQINFLINLEEKLNIIERYQDVNNNISNMIEDFKAVNSLPEDCDINILLNYRSKVGKENEEIDSKFSILARHLDVYIASVQEITTFNKSLSSNIKEKQLGSESLFSASTLKNRVLSMTKSRISLFIL